MSFVSRASPAVFARSLWQVMQYCFRSASPDEDADPVDCPAVWAPVDVIPRMSIAVARIGINRGLGTSATKTRKHEKLVWFRAFVPSWLIFCDVIVVGSSPSPS